MTEHAAVPDVALTAPGDEHIREDWERLAVSVLRKSGRLREKEPDSHLWPELATDSLAGIVIPPLGTPELVADVPTSGRPTRSGSWDVRPWYVGLSPEATSESVRAELETGATSVWLTLGAGGLAAADLAAALDGVHLDLAPVVLDAPHDPVEAARAYVDLLAERGVPPAAGTNLGADPLAAAVRGLDDVVGPGSGPGWTDGLTAVAELAREAGTLAVVVDATAVHDQGGAEYLELGYALAAGTAYLRTLTDAGWSVEEALGLMEFRFAATDDQFVTIAKLRAARRLWARVGEICGADPEARGQRQHAVTSRPMMTRYDPHVNMLRTTVAAFAAGVGGADAVTVLPFDEALGLPDAFARRIARNTSSLLVAESHLARVADPAGGAWAVERMTDDLAGVGWEIFDEIEAAGGAVAVLDDGWLAGHLGDSWGARGTRIGQRWQPVTGVTEYPQSGEALPERAPYPAGTPPVRRLAADFEALRDSPPGQHVFLATMGALAAHTARASFVVNLLAAGGIGVDRAGPTSGVEEVLAAYDGQPVVCLAGPETAYADWGADLIAALRDAGARHVIVAGKSDLEPDDFCAVGQNALEFLRRTREALA